MKKPGSPGSACGARDLMRAAARGSVGTRALLVAALALGVGGAAAWAEELLKVIEANAAIRQGKMTFAKRLAQVPEGDAVAVLGREEPWVNVEYKGVTGWMHQSSLTDDPHPILSGSAVAQNATATEQAAAKKGFTPEVEQEYRKSRAELDAQFKFLDGIEKIVIPDEQVVSFLKAGQLAGFGPGGAR